MSFPVDAYHILADMKIRNVKRVEIPVKLASEPIAIKNNHFKLVVNVVQKTFTYVIIPR